MDPQTSSEKVFSALCLKIGTSQQVTMRRDLVDFSESILKKVHNELHCISNGSRKDGFRFEDSDMDFMLWINDYKVVWDFAQAMLNNIQRYKVILCDTSESPPGYTLLCLPLEDAVGRVSFSCVKINGDFYISSDKYKDFTRCTFGQPNFKVHGPCASGQIFDGPFEYFVGIGNTFDQAHCFVSDFWPPSASSWIDRCHSWPPPRVVDNILRGGCHIVPIGHKLGKHVSNEWRISFSQAEQKLVYAMNHTQFLTYGLLKLFLKEINDGLNEEEKLLCSYHMKTTIFWAIQQNTLANWCPQNLLSTFWVCFKLLLRWVYEGVCPNFFIPKDNMFRIKVHGFAQRNLFTKLYALYEMGITFLLDIPSISSCFMDVLCNPRLSVCKDECTLISEAVLDYELFTEINDNNLFHGIKDLHISMKYLHVVEQLIRSPLTQCQILMLQKLTATILQCSVIILHNMYTTTSRVNKHAYIIDKISCYMLKLAAKFGFVSDLLYIAMYYYKTFRHREALSVIEMTKVKLAKPGMIYLPTPVDPERYTEAVGGQSWFYKMRNAVAFNIELDNRRNFLKGELTLEQQSGLQNAQPSLFIPPFIMLHMLEFLCCRHVDPMRARGTLKTLKFLLHHDHSVLVSVPFRDISWEILGICQQITGKYQAALYSYQQSLRQLPFNKIQTATRQRIQDLQ